MATGDLKATRRIEEKLEPTYSMLILSWTWSLEVDDARIGSDQLGVCLADVVEDSQQQETAVGVREA